MTNQSIDGSCLCGAVKYRIQRPFLAFQYCHCSRCRKTSGSAHASNIFVPIANFSWLAGEEQARRYELPTAKYFCTAFCSVCGSSVPWKSKRGTSFIVPGGGLDVDPGEHPTRNIHWASRASWYVHASTLETFEEGPPPPPSTAASPTK
jgi:hypothetical protein